MKPMARSGKLNTKKIPRLSKVFNGGLHLRVVFITRQITKKANVPNPINRSFLNRPSAFSFFDKRKDAKRQSITL